MINKKKKINSSCGTYRSVQCVPSNDSFSYVAYEQSTSGTNKNKDSYSFLYVSSRTIYLAIRSIDNLTSLIYVAQLSVFWLRLSLPTA